MTSNPVSGILFKRGKVLVARVVRTIHDAHSDAHLELDFILVLVLDLVLSESLPAVGFALFTRCRSALSRNGCFFLPAVGPLVSSIGGSCWCCCEILFDFDCPNLCPLPGVATCERRIHTCNVRPWLRQGLGCPRADPRVHHRTFSHVLRQNFPSEITHHTPSRRLRLAEPPHVLSRATRGLGDPSSTLRKTPPAVRGDK